MNLETMIIEFYENQQCPAIHMTPIESRQRQINCKNSNDVKNIGSSYRRYSYEP